VTVLSLDAPRRQAYARIAADLRRVFGDRFVALVAGAHDTAAAFARRVDAADLDAMSALAETWSHDGLAVPLVMTPEEFRRSLDTFPAEYRTLLDHHIVIDGTPPFDGVVIDHADLRRACEAQARGHLIHLRQGWITAAGHDDRLAALIAQSSAPLKVVLEHLAQLQNEHPGSDEALTTFAARAVGMPADLVASVFALEAHPHRAHTLVPRLAEYLTAAERLWAHVDGWRPAQ
jgi:hypothetical protein